MAILSTLEAQTTCVLTCPVYKKNATGEDKCRLLSIEVDRSSVTGMVIFKRAVMDDDVHVLRVSYVHSTCKVITSDS